MQAYIPRLPVRAHLHHYKPQKAAISKLHSITAADAELRPCDWQPAPCLDRHAGFARGAVPAQYAILMRNSSFLIHNSSFLMRFHHFYSHDGQLGGIVDPPVAVPFDYKIFILLA